MRKLTLTLALGLGSIAMAFAQADEPAPTPEQQKAILDNIGSFVEQYLNTVPNLICTRVTEQYQTGRKGDRWRKGDVLTARLSLVNGVEKRTLELVNGTPLAKVRKPWRTPLLTEGEFGVMLAAVLAESSDAQISWNRWDTVAGKHVAVFDYAIDVGHSRLRMSTSISPEAVVPYSGSVFADPITGTVWRVTESVTQAPPDLHVHEANTVLDYGEVSISNKTYILPVHATAINIVPEGTIRNEISFTGYRKFEAESTINFDTDPQAPPSQAPAPNGPN